MKTSRILTPLAVAFACAFATNAKPTSAESTSNPATSPVDWTPVELAATIQPRAFPGSDGVTNLVYEIILTNYKSAAVPLISFEAFGDTATGEPLLKLDSEAIAPLLISPAGTKLGAKLAPGSVSSLFVNIPLKKDSKVPEKLIHKLSYENREKKETKTSTTTSELIVDKTPPLVIGPPLIGKHWLACGGYYGHSGHRRSLFPIANGLKCAQRFAIDWLQLDDKNRLYAGDKITVESFPGYGKPVIAVADATVFGVVNKFPNQPVFKPSGSLDYPGANTITLKLSDNAYGFYAHLKPGSIKVKEGDRVKKGDVIAELGNAGNSDGPHLHFHVTETPETLGSNGVPYVFEEFEMEGETNQDEIEKNFSTGVSLKIDKPSQPGKHTQQLPKEGALLNWPN